MSPLEIIATVVIALGLLKVLVILASPKSWYRAVVKPVYENAKVAFWAAIILGAVVLYYLLQELSIVQVFAAMGFFMALMLLGFAAFPKDTLEFAEKMYRKKNMLRKAWPTTVIWLALSAWALWQIFG